MDIEQFTSNFGGGARSNLFTVALQNPVDGSGDSIIEFRAMATNVVPMTKNVLEVAFLGRRTYWGGVATLDPWTLTVFEDNSFVVRNALEAWNNKINLQKQNTRDFDSDNDNEYKSTGRILMRRKITDEVYRIYKLFGVWPTNVGPIDMSWENEAVVRYTLTLRYDYFEVEGDTGTAGESVTQVVGR